MDARLPGPHPRTTLVVLPGGGADGGPPAAPLDPVEAEHALAQSQDEVGQRLVDVCAAVGVEARIEVHWRSGSVAGTAGTVRALATAHAPTDVTPGEVYGLLAELGWRVRFTSRAPVPCLDARRDDDVLRAVFHQGHVLITVTGHDIAVGRRRSEQLVGRDEVDAESPEPVG